MTSKFRQESFKRRYTVRNFLKRFLIAAFLVLLIMSLLAAMMGFYKLIQDNIRDALEVSFYKNLHIRSKTISELKQSDMSLVNHDLWVSARYLSSMKEGEETMVSQLYKKRLADYLMNGPDYAAQAEVTPDLPNNPEMASYYIAPEQTSDPNYQAFLAQEGVADIVNKDMEFCSLAVPFLG